MASDLDFRRDGFILLALYPHHCRLLPPKSGCQTILRILKWRLCRTNGLRKRAQVFFDKALEGQCPQDKAGHSLSMGQLHSSIFVGKDRSYWGANDRQIIINLKMALQMITNPFSSTASLLMLHHDLFTYAWLLKLSFDGNQRGLFDVIESW